MGQILMKIKDWIPYIIIIVVVVAFRTFVATPIRVNGPSMQDTMHEGEIVLLKKYDKKHIERFEIVVFNYDDTKLIKRVVGMPKEDIEYKGGTLLINDKEMESKFGKGTTQDFKDYCATDEYFVMGDNREDSLDSRSFGCVKQEDIIGTVSYRVYPFNKWGSVK